LKEEKIVFGHIPTEAFHRLSGLEIFQEMIAGRLPAPPIAGTLDFRMSECEAGRVVFEGTPRHAFDNPLGTVHGGWAATLLDSAMACAVQSCLKQGQSYTTVEMKLNYVRPITEATGKVRCEGKIVSLGKTLATSEGRLVDAAGKLLAHGTETCLIFAARPA
jgi:uncharacterized protein (TIGR00369 family)